MLLALQAADLVLNPSKINVELKKAHYLGHVLSSDDIRIGEDRINIIVALKTPTTIKELCSVVGTTNFVQKFVLNLATVNDSVVALTRKTVANLKTLQK